MTNLSIRKLKVLVAVFDNNFVITNAALDLNVSHANVSVTMHRLANVLHFEPFVYSDVKIKGRRSRIVGLTKKGNELLSYAAEIVECDQLIKEIEKDET